MESLKKLFIIVVALLCVVGSVHAINMELTPEEAQQFVNCEEKLSGMDINLIENMTTASSTAGSSSTELVAANAARKYLAIVNDSDETVYISIGETAVVGKGIRLNANGGSFEMDNSNLSFKAVNGICSSGDKNVTYQEGY